MSKIYYSLGNGVFYSNIKDENLASLPDAIRSKVKVESVFIPSSQRNEDRNRYRTHYIKGHLKYVNFFPSEFVGAKKVLSITLEDLNNVEHVVQMAPYWFKSNTKSGNYHYITDNYFRSIAQVIDQVSLGEEITLAINHKYVSKDKNGNELKTRDGQPYYYKSISILQDTPDGVKALRNDSHPRFDWKVTTSKDPMGNEIRDVNGGEELAYYNAIIEKYIDMNSRGSSESHPTVSTQDIAQPVVAQVEQDDYEDDLPF